MKRIAGLFTTLLLLMTLASCDSRKTAGENPFFTEWDTPHGVPPFPIREDRLHNKQHIMPECKIASVYAVYAVGAFIGRPHGEPPFPIRADSL